MAVEVMDIGRNVQCDWCNKDYTDLPDSGGIIFGSKACCPECSPNLIAAVVRHKEEKYIKARCPVGMSFADWCLELRGGDNTVRFYSGNDFNKAFDGARAGQFSESRVQHNVRQTTEEDKDQ